MPQVKVFYYDIKGNSVETPEKADKVEVHILDSNGMPTKIQYYSTTPKSKNKLLSV